MLVTDLNDDNNNNNYERIATKNSIKTEGLVFL